MSMDKQELPIINTSKPLSTNKCSIDCCKTIKICKTISNKLIKKLNITSRSISKIQIQIPIPILIKREIIFPIELVMQKVILCYIKKCII